jgi:hypothetical protein
MRKRRGQATIEFAVLLVVVIAAFLVMQIYMKRGISGKIRESTDRVGEQFTPLTAKHSLTIGFTGTRGETTTAEGKSTTAIATGTPEKQTRVGSENPTGAAMTSTETLF